ncbi:hypothetical protein [Massilibacterium senegalense]|uniref:hypothetical protein n=1 Tax=Massilibacterium senegalense TaxID=1632858 RepID=UPI0007812AB7|nr:hypothetical protein [Massilibacterium senegalense]
MRHRFFRKRVFVKHRNRQWQQGAITICWAFVVFQALRLLFSPSMFDWILCIIFIVIAIALSIKK